jgi:hypothetical protein
MLCGANTYVCVNNYLVQLSSEYDKNNWNIYLMFPKPILRAKRQAFAPTGTESNVFLVNSRKNNYLTQLRRAKYLKPCYYSSSGTNATYSVMNGTCFWRCLSNRSQICNFNLEFGWLFNERTQLSNVKMIGPLFVRTVIGLATDCRGRRETNNSWDVKVGRRWRCESVQNYCALLWQFGIRQSADGRTSGDLQHPGCLQLLNGSTCCLRNKATAPSSSQHNWKCCSLSTIPRSSEKTRQ